MEICKGDVEMEFIKVRNGYLIKGSNGRIVSEKEKLQLENNEMVIKDFESNNCQKETTKKISKNKKKIKKIEKEEKKIEEPKKYIEEYTTNELKEELNEFIENETAPKKEDDADDTIEETDTTI